MKIIKLRIVVPDAETFRKEQKRLLESVSK